MAKSGELCSKCGAGRLRVVSSSRSCGGTYQVRRLQCAVCKKNHDELEVVLAESVRRRNF